MTISHDPIFKLVPREEWLAAETAGSFAGSAVDHRDGYIHFSTAVQVRETASRHFAGQRGLLIVAVDPAALGEALKWEPSRGGDLFPHLYAELPLSAVLYVLDVPLGEDGAHVFPESVQ